MIKWPYKKLNGFVLQCLSEKYLDTNTNLYILLWRESSRIQFHSGCAGFIINWFLEMYRLLQIEQCIIYSAGNMTNGFQRSIAHELRNFARSEYLRYTWIRDEGPEWKTWHKEDEGGWQERKETPERKEEERRRNCVIIDLCAATPAFSIKLFAVPATNTKIYGQISV